jgi:hypothetical protein
MLRQFYCHAVCVDELAYGITSCAPVANMMHIDKGLQEQAADAARRFADRQRRTIKYRLRRVQWR